MKALSVRQPFASLLMAGVKRFETRDWALSRSYQHTKIALHASKTYDSFDKACTEECMKWSAAAEVILAGLPKGVVLGVVWIETVYRTEDIASMLSEQERGLGNYQPGRAAWLVKVVEVFETPVPANGKLGLWEWSR